MIKIDTSFMVRPFRVGFEGIGGSTTPQKSILSRFARIWRRVWAPLLLVLALSCASAPSIDKMPKYDPEAVNDHYSKIVMTEAMYFSILVTMARLGISEERKVAMDHILDKYIYYSSVAKIHVFNGRWAESDQADSISRQALVELVKVIQKDSI